MEYAEDDFLNLAGIQHFAFCRRQWALIHIEQQWNENLRTAEGRAMHDNAHDPLFSEKRGGLIVSRGMPVFSRALGVNGVCDVVEFHESPLGVTLSGRDGRWLPANPSNQMQTGCSYAARLCASKKCCFVRK